MEERWSAAQWIGFAAAGVLLIGALIAIRQHNAPWPQIGWPVLAMFVAWQTVRKLTSDTPRMDIWYWHIHYLLFGVAVVGGGVALVVTGGETGAGTVRGLGILVGAAGIVMLVAGIRDLRLWRAQVRCERELGGGPQVWRERRGVWEVVERRSPRRNR